MPTTSVVSTASIALLSLPAEAEGSPSGPDEMRTVGAISKGSSVFVFEGVFPFHY